MSFLQPAPPPFDLSEWRAMWPEKVSFLPAMRYYAGNWATSLWLFRKDTAAEVALNALAARAVENVDDYYLRDGEIVAGVVAGWNFGDGHFHGPQLLDAVQEQARSSRASSGLVEEGRVAVAEMVRRGPWLEESFDFSYFGRDHDDVARPGLDARLAGLEVTFPVCTNHVSS